MLMLGLTAVGAAGHDGGVNRTGLVAVFLLSTLTLVGAAVAWWQWWPHSQQAQGGVDLGALPGRAGRDGLNLLVITLDTTRADRIGAYGYRNIETPAIDRLAADGVLFEQAMSSAPLTLPSHCSIFTGRFPPEHGVRDNGGFFLSPTQTTLATMLKARGFQTGAVVGAYVLDGKWGLNQGFTTYVDDFELPENSGFGIGDVKRPGNDVVDRALPMLEKMKHSRFFAWIHFYDPHSPYESPEPFKSRYERRPYAGAIAFTDSQVARLIAFLESNQLLDRTIVAVLGDHGEGLNQHGEGTHGFFIYESTTRVPFIIRAPFEKTRGRRIADPVRTVDLVPTVLDLLGLPAARDIAGVSLAPLLAGTRKTLDLEGYAEALYPLHHFGWSEIRAWRAGQYKVIDAPRPELFDLDKDPEETHNLYAERRAVADGMLARLRAHEHDAAGPAAQSMPDVDPEARARLAALGYVGSFVATVSGPKSDRADPKDKIELFNLMIQSREIAKDKASSERVIAMLNKVIAEDPKVIDAWFNLGNVHYKLGRFEEAIRYFSKTLELKPDYDLAVVNMANAYRRLGKDDAALAGYERYLSIDPKNAHVRYQLGEIYLDRGDVPRAEKNFRQALEIDKRVAAARNALGAIAFTRGDLATAERETRAALALKSTVRLAHFNLALIAEERGDLTTAESEYKQELALHAKTYKAAFNLSRVYERQNRINDQIALLKQSIAANPLFAEGHFFLAKAYLDAGTNLLEAMSLARKGLEIDPLSTVAPLGHFVIAGVMLKQGQPAAAAAEMARGNALEARLAREKQVTR
ncbi:MAG: sulfatase-like hydrolase/transferase [Acidobacteria bacterium]|nr:sulfatase-like hydrolase/transferase [Acidobacteriota bacterium]